VEIALKSVLPESVRQEEEGWRERLHVRALAVSGPMPKLTKRQEEVWLVIEEWRELPLTELLRLTGSTSETVRRLEDKGLVSIAPEISERDPYAREQILPTEPLTLNPEQAKALAAIVERMDKPVAGGSAFLLHGVTGSGKTEIYLQAIAHALERGQGAIVLVPEISLTPQTVERFKARFSSGPRQTLVAVLHSHLSSGERHDEWHKIRQGRARIVIGARSAIFAPVEPLGLIIVDEEHEHSYKQEEAPRYHARDVAVVRGQMEGAAVVLGSATPSMESYYNARRGKYALLELTGRVDDQKMPVVRVVDMRQASRLEKGVPIFSHQLREAILQRLERREQVILFLNRRGWSSSLQCGRCGYVAECPNCSVSLTYHRAGQRLLCHICGHSATAPRACPVATCRNPEVRYSGLGTERVEDTLRKLFPQARIQRMDSDTLKRKEDYRRILGDFRAGKIDLLVGTQMIAKGLHFPNVTLVGIVYADLSLHIPDFRSGERTFQLLTQVAGRAGRGDVEGEVFVQAFTPFHPAIQFARRHDYLGFYDQEIEFREQLKYPPLARIALLVLKGRNEDKVRLSAEHLRAELDRLAAGGGDAGGPRPGPAPGTLSGPDPTEEPGQALLLTEPPPRAVAASAVESTGAAASWAAAGPPFRDLVIAGPAPAPLARAESFYRYQIMLRTRQMSLLSRHLARLTARLELPDDVTVTVDVDPVDLA
jgi:primosomal protein N' (replication factor Y)